MPQTIALLDLISEFPEPFRDPELPPPSLPQTMASLPPAEPLPEESMGRSVKDICLEAIAIIESRNPALLGAIANVLELLAKGEGYAINIPLPSNPVSNHELVLDETYAREYDPTCPGGMCPITGNN